MRGASSEHRVATVMADDGVYDVVSTSRNFIDDKLRSEIKENGFEGVKVIVRG